MKLAPVHKGQRETEERGSHSRLVGDRFNTHGNLHMRLALGGPKTSRYLPLPTRILKVYVETLMGFSHMFHLGDLKTLLSQDCVLENSSHCGNGGQNVHSKNREVDEEPPTALV